MKIQLLSSNINSWIVPYGRKLEGKLVEMGHECEYLFHERDVKKGDILIFMSYERIFKSLHLNKHNLVIHESDLPKGRGMSPLSWQILEGNNTIHFTLLEANEGIDEGDYYLKDKIVFKGHELFTELKHAQGEKTIEMVLNFLHNYNSLIPIKQQGEPTYLKRRTPTDSQLDINKSIKEQFNLLRIVDNNNYPAYFEYLGETYFIKIDKK